MLAHAMISQTKRVLDRKIFYPLKHIADKRHVSTCHVRGSDILLEVHSEIEKFRAKTYATKERETLDWIERYFKPGEVMYDIGANIGLYSLFAAKHLRGQCKVYAFEPEALNHAQLSKSIYLNGLSDVVLPCCLAVTDKLCFDRFYLHPRNFQNMAAGHLVPGSALHSFGSTEDYSGASFQPFHLQGAVGVSLDHLWQTWGLDFPNHVKIDVDGLEEKIIGGAKQTLADPRLKSVLVEVSAAKGASDPILQRLTQAGFVRVTDFSAHSSELLKGARHEDCVNSVFVRK
jgi:FkbM family methyltransferase